MITPRVTEKSAILSETRGVYVFNVGKDDTKQTVAREVKAKHKVTPLMVRIVNVKPKAVVFRGRRGKRVGSKKAYVYLKKGDKISFA